MISWGSTSTRLTTKLAVSLAGSAKASWWAATKLRAAAAGSAMRVATGKRGVVVMTRARPVSLSSSFTGAPELCSSASRA